MSIEKFKSECKRLGVDYENIFILGEGDKYDKSGRYIHTNKNIEIKSQHIYAIKYFTSINTFLAWDAKNKATGSAFSVKAADVPTIEDDKIHFVDKYIGHRGKKKEKVLAFKEGTIAEFLTKYVLKK